MRKIDKDKAMQYYIEYGSKEASKVLHITEEELSEIIWSEPKEVKWTKPYTNVNATIDHLNPTVSNFIDRKYSELYSQYVKNDSNNILYQSDEDVFHNALIKLCDVISNPSDSEISKKFDKIYKEYRYRANMDHRKMRQKELNIKIKEDEDGENK